MLPLTKFVNKILDIIPILGSIRQMHEINRQFRNTDFPLYLDYIRGKFYICLKTYNYKNANPIFPKEFDTPKEAIANAIKAWKDGNNVA